MCVKQKKQQQQKNFFNICNISIIFIYLFIYYTFWFNTFDVFLSSSGGLLACVVWAGSEVFI